VQPLKEANPMPRDVPLDQLTRLLREVEATADGGCPKERRMGVMDRAWVLLMVHCGLRTGEVRRMALSDLNLEARRVRIEKSKGLKDRIVYLSPATMDALRAYLPIRGPAATDHIFVHRHRALKASYCARRLRTYGERCGVRITPHQLRHTCATLLLNAGAPPAIVQAILGHRHIDTTMRYARLYDSTVATDYFGAMSEIEARMELAERGNGRPISGGQLLALVDTLRTGTLNDDQKQTVLALRTGILTLLA
jgi:integrase